MITAYFDGAVEPVNPGGTASYGAVVFREGERLWECSELFRPEKGRERETSNNVAEYCGFLAVLDYLIATGLDEQNCEIRGDSKLVIEQMLGNWQIRGGVYKPLALRALARLREFRQRPALRWIPRDENGIADELSKAELKKAGVKFQIQSA